MKYSSNNVVTGSYVDPEQAAVTWEGGTSTEKVLPPIDLWASLWDVLLTDDRRAQVQVLGVL